MSGRERSLEAGFFALRSGGSILLSGKPPTGSRPAAFTATLSGRVTDPSGLAVNGAKVTLTSPDLGFSRTYSTGDTGLYNFTFLPPASYALEVEAPGFKQYKQEGITLAAGQNAEQQVSLVRRSRNRKRGSHIASATS